MFRVKSNFSKEVTANGWGEVDIVETSSDRKFDYIISNPPYQGNNHSQMYPAFYVKSIRIANNVCMIFPTGWQEPKDGNNLRKMNNPEVKEDKQIMFIDNRQNVFTGVMGAEWTNIIAWRNGYDNGLNGKQKVLTNGKNEEIKNIFCTNDQVLKPKEFVTMFEYVKDCEDFHCVQEIMSTIQPYGLRSDITTNTQKYNLAPLQDNKISTDDMKIYCKNGVVKFAPKNYSLPKETLSKAKFKVFVPYAWGNMAENGFFGGAFSNIIIGQPNEICSETYLESGNFDDYVTASYHAKFLMTKFARALLFLNKFSQHSTTSWAAVPQQSYNEKWWTESIKEIDEHLFEKYNIPENIREFVRNNIQPKTEENIVNFNKD